MKVHFITSRPSLENDIDRLRAIISIIHENGHYLARDWVEVAYRRQVELKKPADDWGMIYKDNLEAIAQSDVIIAETTYENFAVGYQVAVAVQQKKPILLMRHASADKNAFATGVDDDWAQHGQYDDDTLPLIIKNFIEENDIKTKDLRFNFFIDRQIYNYLRWTSLRTNKTKAEVLRDLVVREIEKQNN